MQIYSKSPMNAPAQAQPPGIAPAEQGQRSAKISSPPADTQPGQVDRVQFSGLAQRLAASSAAKISQLQSAIDAGTYTISPSNIAKSIISQSIGD